MHRVCAAEPVAYMTAHMFETYFASCTNVIEKVKSDRVNYRVHLPTVVAGETVRFLASAPGDRSGSFSGSLLPFATEEMALEGTVNRGTVLSEDGRCDINIAQPNSYYMNRELIPPCVYLLVNAVVYRAILSQPVPHRRLAGLVYRTPDGFKTRYPSTARSQESILLSSAYPACVPDL
jgi:hypothetical protein